MEIVGLIASVIGIISVFFAIIKFLLRPYIESKKEYKKILEIIDVHFKKWKELSYLARADSLIIGENFSKINKYQHKLQKLNKEKFSFLLRCAIQNGMNGKWGDWLVLNKDNEKIIPALVVALDGNAGWRPIWRSAFILEKTLGKKIKYLFNQMPDEMQQNENLKLVFKIINGQGVYEYLLSISEGNNGNIKSKAQLVLQEIDQFSVQLAEYIKSKKQQSLENLSTLNSYNDIQIELDVN